MLSLCPQKSYIKRQHHEASLENCIICQESSRKDRGPLFNQTANGISTIREATELRCKLRHSEFRTAVDRLTSFFGTDNITELKWHKLCYRDYANLRKIRNKLSKEQANAHQESTGTNISATQRPFLRSDSTKMDWSLCLFCQSSAKKQKLSRVSTVNMNSKICKNAKFVHEVFVRIADVNDLMAADALYHLDCLSKFFRDAQRAETECKSTNMTMVWLCQELRQSADKGHVLELSTVLKDTKS